MQSIAAASGECAAPAYAGAHVNQAALSGHAAVCSHALQDFLHPGAGEGAVEALDALAPAKLVL